MALAKLALQRAVKIIAYLKTSRVRHCGVR